MERNDTFTNAILGSLDPIELGTPMTVDNAKYMLAGRNPKLLQAQWLSDPLRALIDAKLDIPPTMHAHRDPLIQSPSRWKRVKPLLVPLVLGLAGGGLLIWGIARSGVLT